MTQADLAFALREYPTLSKLIPSRISDWENERVGRLSFSAIDAIARVTGKPLEFFSELPDAENGDAGRGRPRALPASADLDDAKAPHEHDPRPPRGKPTRRPRGTQADT